MEMLGILPETLTIYFCINLFIKVDQLIINIDCNSNLKKSDE